MNDSSADLFCSREYSAKANEKNQIQTPWTLYGKLFGPQAFSPVSGMTLNDKMDVYFHDFSMMPLFVQDNYLKANYAKVSGLDGRKKQLKDLELVAAAAESISDGDLVDHMVHGSVSFELPIFSPLDAILFLSAQQWSLLPVHGIFSCITPGYYCSGSGTRSGIPSAGFGGPAFPA